VFSSHRLSISYKFSRPLSTNCKVRDRENLGTFRGWGQLQLGIIQVKAAFQREEWPALDACRSQCQTATFPESEQDEGLFGKPEKALITNDR
jgi:hypothetical protein